MPQPPYGRGLKTQVRPKEPEQFLDSLLVTGLIEARSHERLGLLAAHCPEAELAKFYCELGLTQNDTRSGTIHVDEG